MSLATSVTIDSVSPKPSVAVLAWAGIATVDTVMITTPLLAITVPLVGENVKGEAAPFASDPVHA